MMGMGSGMPSYQPYTQAYAQPTTQSQTYYQPQSYSARPATGRKRGASQFLPGMGAGMPGMGMGMGGGGLNNMLFLDAMTGGDLMNNDFAQDMSSMMMMNSMMRRPGMMNGGMMGGYPMYGGYQSSGMYPGYYYPQTTTGAQTQPTDTTSTGGFGSRIKDKIKGKRGSMADQMMAMNMFQNWNQPNAAAGAGTSETPVGDAPADQTAPEVVAAVSSDTPVSKDAPVATSDKAAPVQDAATTDKKVV